MARTKKAKTVETQPTVCADDAKPVNEMTMDMEPETLKEVSDPQALAGDAMEVEPSVAAGQAASKKANAKKRQGGTNAFMMFCKEYRSSVLEDNPALKMTEVSKVLGAKWKEQSDATRDEYKQKAAAANDARRSENVCTE